eukprot:54289-Eustigmatos_ZCMA.PRE.1
MYSAAWAPRPGRAGFLGNAVPTSVAPCLFIPSIAAIKIMCKGSNLYGACALATCFANRNSTHWSWLADSGFS